MHARLPCYRLIRFLRRALLSSATASQKSLDDVTDDIRPRLKVLSEDSYFEYVMQVQRSTGARSRG